MRMLHPNEERSLERRAWLLSKWTIDSKWTYYKSRWHRGRQDTDSSIHLNACITQEDMALARMGCMGAFSIPESDKIGWRWLFPTESLPPWHPGINLVAEEFWDVIDRCHEIAI